MLSLLTKHRRGGTICTCWAHEERYGIVGPMGCKIGQLFYQDRRNICQGHEQSRCRVGRKFRRGKRLRQSATKSAWKCPRCTASMVSPAAYLCPPNCRSQRAQCCRPWYRSKRRDTAPRAPCRVAGNLQQKGRAMVAFQQCGPPQCPQPRDATRDHPTIRAAGGCAILPCNAVVHCLFDGLLQGHVVLVHPSRRWARQAASCVALAPGAPHCPRPTPGAHWHSAGERAETPLLQLWPVCQPGR